MLLYNNKKWSCWEATVKANESESSHSAAKDETLTELALRVLVFLRQILWLTVELMNAIYLLMSHKIQTTSHSSSPSFSQINKLIIKNKDLYEDFQSSITRSVCQIKFDWSVWVRNWIVNIRFNAFILGIDVSAHHPRTILFINRSLN